MNYKLYIRHDQTQPDAAVSSSGTSFLFQTDELWYKKFKIDIAAGAELTDANNNVMTSEQANTFLATLP